MDDYKYRFIDQPKGWVGEKTHPDMPILTNLRLDTAWRIGPSIVALVQPGRRASLVR